MKNNRYTFIFEYGDAWTISCFEDKDNKHHFNHYDDNWNTSLNIVNEFMKNGGNIYWYKGQYNKILKNINTFKLDDKPIELLSDYLNKHEVIKPKYSINISKEEFIARVRYLGWICFQMGAGLPLHDVPENYEISQERLEGLIGGTIWALENPNATPEDNHNSWMESKRQQGYVYGEQLSIKNKTHPSMVPFEELSKIEQDKDIMDLLMVKLANKLYDKITET